MKRKSKMKQKSQKIKERESYYFLCHIFVQQFFYKKNTNNNIVDFSIPPTRYLCKILILNFSMFFTFYFLLLFGPAKQSLIEVNRDISWAAMD